MSSRLHHILIEILVLITFLMIGCGNGSFPASNNTDRAEDIITQYYSDEALSELVRCFDDGTYNNLCDLDGVFQIECIRDPRQFDKRNMPYVVIMSESGKKVFLFFRPFEEAQKDAGELLSCNFTDSFMSKDVMWNTIQEMAGTHATWADWLVLLEKYESGMSSGARHHQFTLAVNEGMYGIVLSRDESNTEQIQEIVFLSDDRLMNDPDYAWENGWAPWLILPIDKA